MRGVTLELGEEAAKPNEPHVERFGVKGLLGRCLLFILSVRLEGKVVV